MFGKCFKLSLISCLFVINTVCAIAQYFYVTYEFDEKNLVAQKSMPPILLSSLMNEKYLFYESTLIYTDPTSEISYNLVLNETEYLVYSESKFNTLLGVNNNDIVVILIAHSVPHFITIPRYQLKKLKDTRLSAFKVLIEKEEIVTFSFLVKKENTYIQCVFYVNISNEPFKKEQSKGLRFRYEKFNEVSNNNAVSVVDFNFEQAENNNQHNDSTEYFPSEDQVESEGEKYGFPSNNSLTKKKKRKRSQKSSTFEKKNKKSLPKCIHCKGENTKKDKFNTKKNENYERTSYYCFNCRITFATNGKVRSKETIAKLNKNRIRRHKEKHGRTIPKCTKEGCNSNKHVFAKGAASNNKYNYICRKCDKNFSLKLTKKNIRTLKASQNLIPQRVKIAHAIFECPICKGDNYYFRYVTEHSNKSVANYYCIDCCSIVRYNTKLTQTEAREKNRKRLIELKKTLGYAVPVCDNKDCVADGKITHIKRISVISDNRTKFFCSACSQYYYILD